MDRNAYPTLALNADYTPFATWTWQDAVRALLRGLAHGVNFYDKSVSSPSTTVVLPSVVALNRYVNVDRPAAFTRRNVWIAWRGMCSLCACKLTSETFTFEHVIPRSRGGDVKGFNNVSAACVDCNQKKGNRTLEEAGMSLIRPMFHPTERELIEARMAMSFETPPHESWSDYLSELYWTVPLEE
jgi:5-methylcytosine-specific restriction endonuclease McrA